MWVYRGPETRKSRIWYLLAALNADARSLLQHCVTQIPTRDVRICRCAPYIMLCKEKEDEAIFLTMTDLLIYMVLGPTSPSSQRSSVVFSHYVSLIRIWVR